MATTVPITILIRCVVRHYIKLEEKNATSVGDSGSGIDP